LFELGLFYGHLGAERCFFTMPRGVVDFHLPTDLLGIAPLTYSASRSDGNLVAALATAANQVRRVIRKVVPILQNAPSTIPAFVGNLPSLGDFVASWNGPELKQARDKVRSMPMGEYGPERDALGEIFVFLESLSDAVLAGRIDEREARIHFGDVVPSVWSVAFHELAPPNHADEWWEPLPRIAELSRRWQT
jgi:hypothetical protein